MKLLANLKNELTDIFNSYLLGSTKPVITPFGFKFVGSKSIHHINMQKGAYEPEITALIQEQLKKCDIFVDVGCNIGYYSCIAKIENKRVIAIEPLSENLKYLYKNMIINDWGCEVYSMGVSSAPGINTFYGASSTGASLIENWAGTSSTFKRIIPLSTLDIILGNRFNGKKLFIKIDVEGFEYDVLFGAINTLNLTPKPTLLIEICNNEFHPSGKNPHFQATFALMKAQGYEAKKIDSINYLFTPIEQYNDYCR